MNILWTISFSILIRRKILPLQTTQKKNKRLIKKYFFMFKEPHSATRTACYDKRFLLPLSTQNCIQSLHGPSQVDGIGYYTYRLHARKNFFSEWVELKATARRDKTISQPTVKMTHSLTWTEVQQLIPCCNCPSTDHTYKGRWKQRSIYPDVCSGKAPEGIFMAWWFPPVTASLLSWSVQLNSTGTRSDSMTLGGCLYLWISQMPSQLSLMMSQSPCHLSTYLFIFKSCVGKPCSQDKLQKAGVGTHILPFI